MTKQKVGHEGYPGEILVSDTAKGSGGGWSYGSKELMGQNARVVGVHEMAFVLSRYKIDRDSATNRLSNAVLNGNKVYAHIPSQYAEWCFTYDFFKNLDEKGLFQYKYAEQRLTRSGIAGKMQRKGLTGSEYTFVYNNALQIYDEAVAYGEMIRNFVEPKNNTKNSDIRAYLKGNNIIVGPMNVTFTEKTVTLANNITEYLAGFSGVEVRDIYGSLINGCSICDKDGNAIIPKSNTNFYISLPKSANGISNIWLSFRRVAANADFYVFTNPNSTQLELFLTETDRYYAGDLLDIPLYIPSFKGNLKVTKKESDTNQAFNNASFKIKNEDGQYLRINSQSSYTGILTANSIEYVDIGQATEFRPSNGIFGINDLWIGNYIVEEVGIDIYGYAAKSSPKSLNVPPDSTGEATMYNEKQTGNLVITKQDLAKPEKKLAGMEFKIKNASNQYIIINGVSSGKYTGKVLVTGLTTTTDKNLASTFVTDSGGDNQGKIGIYNLLIGTYYIEETSVGPNDRYAVDSKLTPVTVTRRSSTYTNNVLDYNTEQADKTTITNKLRYVDISGTVWEDIGYANGKLTEWNDLFKHGVLDNRDDRAYGIKVRIKDRQGNVITNSKGTKCEMDTKQGSGSDGKGGYKFTYVDVEQFANYTIEFEYNGMKYEAVKYPESNLEDLYKNKRESSSKAGDTSTESLSRENFAIGASAGKTRKDLNDKYNTITAQSDVQYVDGEYDTKIVYEGTGPKYYEPQTRYSVIADTRTGKYDLSKYYDPVNDYDEMKHMNLGIKERTQPDLRLKKDINSVRVEINDRIHVYKYGDRDKVSEEIYKNIEKSDVRFQKENEYGGMTYTRAVYASDILNVENVEKKGNNATDKDKLKVNIIYKIELRNQSEVDSIVNEITEHYDTKYERNIIAGRELDNTGKVVESGIEVGEITEETSEYNKVTLKPNIKVGPGKIETMYIMLQVKQEALKEVVKIGESNETLEPVKLDNIVEITSYTTMKKGTNDKIAGVDIDSRPENADVNKIGHPETVTKGEITTYEDDTERAPGFILELNTSRETKGTVFLDEVIKPSGINDTEKLMTNNERRGDSEYKEATIEKGIAGVTVELVDLNGNVVDVYEKDEGTGKWDWRPSTRTTNDNGEYSFGGYIPGDYKIKFTWGDGTYRVQDYKGTIYVQERNDNTANGTKYSPETDTFWYKKDGNGDASRRYSDAIDDYGLRQKIDNQIKEATNRNKGLITEAYTSGGQVNIGDEKVITKMESYTPVMNVRLEYADGYGEAITDYLTNDSNNHSRIDNIIENVDFGIIERPRQEINLEKHVKRVRLILTNGTILVDATVIKDPDTKSYRLENEINYTTYLPESSGVKGNLKIEIDKELVQGATLEITYKFVAKNISEKDYVTEDYYKYGKLGRYEDLVALTVNEIIEYLDNETAVVEEHQTGKVQGDTNQYSWSKQENIEELQNDNKGRLSTEDSLKSYLNTVEKIFVGTLTMNPLRPGDEEVDVAEFITSKILASAIDITLENNTEVIKLTKTGGSTLESTPGNYNPAKMTETDENDSDVSEQVIVVRPTGGNRDYIMYVTIGLVSLGILGVGAVILKKKVLTKTKK